jgi:hypothetical protein
LSVWNQRIMNLPMEYWKAEGVSETIQHTVL